MVGAQHMSSSHNWKIVAATLIAATLCALLFAIVFHRRLLDAALLYSFYLQPKDFREAQCGDYDVKEGFDECWAPYFNGPWKMPASCMCWDAVLHRGICTEESGTSESCMDKVTTVCEWLYPGTPCP